MYINFPSACVCYLLRVNLFVRPSFLLSILPRKSLPFLTSEMSVSSLSQVDIFLSLEFITSITQCFFLCFFFQTGFMKFYVSYPKLAKNCRKRTVQVHNNRKRHRTSVGFLIWFNIYREAILRELGASGLTAAMLPTQMT